jgi:hypothetical protein
LLDRLSQLGAQAVTASYLFVTPIGSKARLRSLPFLGDAINQCNELCPIEGGAVYSVPLQQKQELYTWLAQQCSARGLQFATCGCKDLRLDASVCPTACTYPSRSQCTAASLKPVVTVNPPADMSETHAN